MQAYLENHAYVHMHKYRIRLTHNKAACPKPAQSLTQSLPKAAQNESPRSAQNEPKMNPKWKLDLPKSLLKVCPEWAQNEPKMNPKWWTTFISPGNTT